MKYNILHVITRLPVGGVENMILKVVNGYDKGRYNISICCMDGGGEIADELIKQGYKVTILDSMKRHGFDISLIKALYGLLKNDNIHILRTHQYHANLYGRIAGIMARVPVIVPSFHNLYISPKNPKFHRRLINFILCFFSDSMVAVSQAVASDMKRFDLISSDKIKIIYNGVVLEQFKTSSSKQGERRIFNLPAELLIIGSTGRLTGQKGHRYLIEAASKIENTVIAIAGDGPLDKELQMLAKKLDVRCMLLGRIVPEKIPAFLSSLDIFCFPSLWEGFPSALIEAMAAGVPVVVSDIQPHREVIGNAGILVPPGNSEKLAEALNMLSGDISARDDLGRRARERATMFSIENTVKDYETLYEDILKKKGLL